MLSQRQNQQEIETSPAGSALADRSRCRPRGVETMECAKARYPQSNPIRQSPWIPKAYPPKSPEPLHARQRPTEWKGFFIFTISDHVQAAEHVHEEKIIYKCLKHVQASIMKLEQKYENIQAKTVKNTEIVFTKLNEIHATTTHLENNDDKVKELISTMPAKERWMFRSGQVEQRSNPTSNRPNAITA